MLAACGLAAGRCRAAAAGRGALDRRRAGGAGRAAAAGRGLRLRTARSSRQRSREAGGEPVAFGAFPDDEAALEAAVRDALEACDMVVLSGGTSKGAGDLSHRIVSRLGEPGVIVHGVALKPGKPLCLAVAQGKPVIVLPGFPTSAIFTFHAFVAPVIRAKAGLPPEAARAGRCHGAGAYSLGARPQGIRAGRAGGGRGWRRSRFRSARAPARSRLSRRPTAFSKSMRCARRSTRARREGHADRAGARARPRHRRQPLRRARCGALRAVSARHFGAHHCDRQHGRRRGGAARRMRSCADPSDGPGERTSITSSYAKDGLALVRGWQRMQGIVFRMGDARFEGRSAQDALKAVLADPDCIMVNRNAGAGTRILIDQLLGSARPPGYGNQPRSHNAVAAAVAQRRADWGVAIQSVAAMYGLGLPATVAGKLRFSAGREPPRTPGGCGLSQGAGRSCRARANRGARHGAGLI